MMFTPFVLLLCLLHAGHAWVIEVNKNPVTMKLTHNVTIHCQMGRKNTFAPKLEEIYRMLITKYNDANQWDIVAEITKNDPIVKTSLSSAAVTGQIDRSENTFLKMNFAVATDELIGQFVCEIDGVEPSRDIQTIKTRPIFVTEQTTSFDDIMEFLVDFKKEEYNKNQELTKKIDDLNKQIASKDNDVSTVVNNITNFMNKISVDLIDLQTNVKEKKDKDGQVSVTFNNKIGNISLELQSLANQQEELIEMMKELKKNNEQCTPPSLPTTTPQPETTTVPGPAAWPSGTYTLLMPEDDCPDSTHWDFSALRISTKPGLVNGDSSSKDFNAYGDIFQRSADHSYVSLSLCSKIDEPKAPQWPKGSYCFQIYSLKGDRNDNECPTGFHYGFSRYGRYNDGSLDLVDNLPSAERTSSATTAYYCCRNDGLPSSPIRLPSDHPFYLYRYGETCQKVAGAKVSNQWIHLDTVRANDGFSSNYHPDGNHRDGFKVQLCYYTPNK